jgi:predicted nucleotidyltransferase
LGKNEIVKMLRDYKQRYAEKYGIKTLGLFGSVARDQSGENSDLDICVTMQTPNPFLLAHIKVELEQIVHRRVDIVRVREKMNPFLKKRIEKDGIYV